MKLSKKKLAVILLLIVTLIMAAVLSAAYYTDNNEKNNVFTTGNVKISLSEERYDLPENTADREHLSPREEVIKDPKVTNTGISDCFVFVEIFVPRTNRILIDENGNKLPQKEVDVFSFETRPEWVLMEEGETQDSVTRKPYSRYVYAYATGGKGGKMTVLKRGKSTPTLFLNDKIKYKNFIELDKNITYELPVYAYAIQTTDIMTGNDIMTEPVVDGKGTDIPGFVWKNLKAQKIEEERSVEEP